MSYPISQPYSVFADIDGQPLENGYIYIGTANLDAQANPITVYWDAAGTITASQPIRTLNGYPVWNGTAANIYVSASDCSIKILNKNGTLVTSKPTSRDQEFASNMLFIPAGTGSVASTVQTKLRESTNAVSDFGADNTGVSNATTALLNFFNYCISTGTPGHIPAGTYLVTAGVLAFDNGFTDKPWPNITTDGYNAVIFKRADATNAAMISITNGTASSPVAKTWQGGCLGGITFDQNGKAKGSNQHGLLLLGVVETSFGHMRMNDGGGSCICIPEKLYTLTNPDPYNVVCTFEAAEANRCGGYAFYNNNGVGLSGCTIKYLRAIENIGGAFFGFGAGTVINVFSAGSCSGWAFGNRNDSIGASQRFTVIDAEIDDIQYGIDMRRVSNSIFGVSAVRFNHRYNFGPLNPSGGYWPRIAVQVATNGIAMNNLRIIDRIEAGGTKPDLGQFFDFGNGGGNTVDIQIQRQIIDNAGFGFTAADYYTNFNTNATVLYTDRIGLPIIDTRKKTASIARAPITFAVPNGGFTTAPNTVQYSTELTDPSDSYDPATWTYTARSPGVYRIAARIVLAVAIGTRIRMAIMTNGTIAISRFFYATTANAQCYNIDYEAVLSAGTTININADQNTGGAVNLTAMSVANENTFFVTQV